MSDTKVIRCTVCRGKKVIMCLGMMLKKCTACSGAGNILKQEMKSENTQDDTTDEVIKKVRRSRKNEI